MKTVKVKGKLSLNKETISKLNDQQMSNVIGGTLRTIACSGSNLTNTPTLIDCCL